MTTDELMKIFEANIDRGEVIDVERFYDEIKQHFLPISLIKKVVEEMKKKIPHYGNSTVELDISYNQALSDLLTAIKES